MAARMGLIEASAFVAVGMALAACGGASVNAEGSGDVSVNVDASGSAAARAGAGADGSHDPATREAWGTAEPEVATGPFPEPVDGTDPVDEEPDLPAVATGPVVATLPAFQELRGNRSVVFLRLSGRVPITETRTAGRLVYRMPGVVVPARTNQFDLPTSYFATPVGRVHLLQVGAGAELIVELRERARPLARVRRSGEGVALRLEFPRLDSTRVPEQTVLGDAP